VKGGEPVEEWGKRWSEEREVLPGVDLAAVLHDRVCGSIPFRAKELNREKSLSPQSPLRLRLLGSFLFKYNELVDSKVLAALPTSTYDPVTST
jgi:hypothetical protein